MGFCDVEVRERDEIDRTYDAEDEQLASKPSSFYLRMRSKNTSGKKEVNEREEGLVFQGEFWLGTEGNGVWEIWRSNCLPSEWQLYYITWGLNQLKHNVVWHSFLKTLKGIILSYIPDCQTLLRNLQVI